TPFRGEIAAPVTQTAAGRIVHSASLREGPVAPGQLLSIFGEGIGPATPAVGAFSDGETLDTLVAGTQVLFDGRPVPLISVQQNQFSVQAPSGLARGSRGSVEVCRAGVRRTASTVDVASAAPGIFTVTGGAGPALVTNQDGSANSAANPADPGSVITLSTTGT